MSKIHHYLKNITNFNLTTPSAIILGAVIIGVSILGYGLIMSNDSSSTSTTNPLQKILKDIGVSKKDFASCVNGGEMAQAVSDSTADGVKAGVQGTPSTFIIKEQDGVQYVSATVDGAQSYEFFKQAIDQALSSTSVSGLARFKGKPVDGSDLQEMTSPTHVYVVEYSDAECPFCIGVHNTIKQVRTDYAGKISFVYRNFPLTSIHQHAQKEAEMLSCVAKLGGAKAFFKYINESFDYKVKNNIGYMNIDWK